MLCAGWGAGKLASLPARHGHYAERDDAEYAREEEIERPHGARVPGQDADRPLGSEHEEGAERCREGDELEAEEHDLVRRVGVPGIDELR